MATNLTPANPQLTDLIGAHIEYVYAEPYGGSPIVKTGTITEINQHKGTFYMRVQPDDSNRLGKWRTEHHFIRYLAAINQIEKIVA